MLRILTGICLGAALGIAAPVQQGSRSTFVVVTRGQLGFRDGDRFYPVGMDAGAFVKRFGEPEARSPRFLYYYDEGLTVALSQKGQTISYLFAVHDGRAPDGSVIRSANVKTDAGITRESAYRLVIKLHGRPDAEMTRNDARLLVFGFGVLVFQHGGLSTLSIGLSTELHDALVKDFQAEATRKEEGENEKRRLVKESDRRGREGMAADAARQKEPFGPEAAKAPSLVIVVDATGSMVNKFSTARRAVSRFLGTLNELQRFNVIGACESPGSLADGLVAATFENRAKAGEFLEDKITPRGDDKALDDAFQRAIKMKPALIVFVTDGDFELDPIEQQVRTAHIPLSLVLIKGTEYEWLHGENARQLTRAAPGGSLITINDDGL